MIYDLYTLVQNVLIRNKNKIVRIGNSFSRIINSFPRFTQLVLLGCDSFPQFTNCNPRENELCKLRERINYPGERITKSGNGLHNSLERCTFTFLLLKIPMSL